MFYSSDTFGDLVKQYITQHCLSYQDFASTLGFKSKTSISRIIQNETSYELRSQFYKRLSKLYPLTAQEENAFRNALRMSRLSETDQVYFRCFSNLLNADYELEKQSDILYSSPKSEQTHSLRELLNRRSEACYRITVSIFGLPGTQFITTLYQMLNEDNRPYLIRHYMFSGEDIMPQIRCVADSAPFLFDQRYKIYCCPRNTDMAILGNHLILQYSMEDGTQAEDVFLLNEHGVSVYSGPLSSSFTELYRYFFLTMNGPEHPLKAEYGQDSQDDQLHSFIGVQKKMIELEERCAVYCFKKGLSVEFIPPEIYKNAIQVNRLAQYEGGETLSSLMLMQKKRHQNLLAKKKPRHYLLSKDSFQRFIWTGRLGIHPSFLRLLSPKERYDTLTLILNQMEQNPYFSLRFATEDLPPIYNHLALIGFQRMPHASAHQAKGGDGLLIQPGLESAPYTSHVTLADEQLAASFSLFFREELLPQYAEPVKKTQRFLYGMLDYLQTKIL